MNGARNEWILTAQSYIAYRCVCPKNLSIDRFPTLYPGGMIEPHAVVPECPSGLYPESLPPIFK